MSWSENAFRSMRSRRISSSMRPEVSTISRGCGLEVTVPEVVEGLVKRERLDVVVRGPLVRRPIRSDSVERGPARRGAPG